MGITTVNPGQRSIYQPLERRGGVSYAHRHHFPLERPVFNPKCRLVAVFFNRVDLPEAILEIHLGEKLRLKHSITLLRRRHLICIFLRYSI